MPPGQTRGERERGVGPAPRAQPPARGHRGLPGCSWRPQAPTGDPPPPGASDREGPPAARPPRGAPSPRRARPAAGSPRPGGCAPGLRALCPETRAALRRGVSPGSGETRWEAGLRDAERCRVTGGWGAVGPCERLLSAFEPSPLLYPRGVVSAAASAGRVADSGGAGLPPARVCRVRAEFLAARVTWSSVTGRPVIWPPSHPGPPSLPTRRLGGAGFRAVCERWGPRGPAPARRARGPLTSHSGDPGGTASRAAASCPARPLSRGRVRAGARSGRRHDAVAVATCGCLHLN